MAPRLDMARGLCERGRRAEDKEQKKIIVQKVGAEHRGREGTNTLRITGSCEE